MRDLPSLSQIVEIKNELYVKSSENITLLNFSNRAMQLRFIRILREAQEG